MQEPNALSMCGGRGALTSLHDMMEYRGASSRRGHAKNACVEWSVMQA